jgi:cytochrome c biogenesis protein CcmG/thiol:disulfide interchange protein DsbE
MAKQPNRPSRPAPRAADAAGATSRRSSLLWLWVALGVVVVLLAGFAILSAGDDAELTVGTTVPAGDGATEGTGDGTTGGEGTSATDGGSDDGTTGGGQIAEAWPVEITGTPLVQLPRDGGDPALGTAAPGLSGFSFDGTPVAVDPSEGPVMLVFLAHWCPHCNREIPELNALRDGGGLPADLQVVGIATGTDPNAENFPPSEWIPRMDWTWPVIADSPDFLAASAFGLSGFPFTVILDTDGTVLDRWSGEIGRDGVAARVAAALG